jgi:hypothetical protein
MTSTLKETKKEDEKMTDTTKGGLDNDDVWGDVDDPLAELDKMNDEQI